MGFRLALALSISVLLIGVASWHRFGGIEQIQPHLVSIESLESEDNDYKSIVGEFNTPKSATSTVSTEVLSNADLIGRQMILDYVGLASSGQTTEAHLEALANKYVESIATLNKATVVGVSEINVVSNSESNLLNYAAAFKKIHDEYAGELITSGIQNTNVAMYGQDLFSSTKVFSVAYGKAAAKLKIIPVPNAVATHHLQLVNSYLSSSMAMGALSNAQDDPASAFGGLSILNTNLTNEDKLVATIGQILIANGI